MGYGIYPIQHLGFASLDTPHAVWDASPDLNDFATRSFRIDQSIL